MLSKVIFLKLVLVSICFLFASNSMAAQASDLAQTNKALNVVPGVQGVINWNIAADTTYWLLTYSATGNGWNLRCATYKTNKECEAAGNKLGHGSWFCEKSKEKCKEK